MRAARIVGLGLLAWVLFGAGPRAVVPLDVVEPMPIRTMAPAWLAALEDAGARVADDFESEVAGVHPIETGRWSRAVMASVDGPGGTLQLTGTVVVEAVGPAESRVRLEPGAETGRAEALAWRLVVRKATRQARAVLAGQATTPAEVQAQITRVLTDPLACVPEVAALGRIGSPAAAEVLLQARDDLASSCVPAALSVVARSVPDNQQWSDWFRRAWNHASPVERASLASVLVDIEPVPPDLAALRQGLRLEQEIESDAADAAARLQATAPVLCADGSVDPECRCSDPPTACCVHHGGVDQCLPPPPR